MRSNESNFSKIPETWRIDELRSFLSLITYGFTNPMPDAIDGPWKITAKDVVDGRINYLTSRKTTQEAFDKLLTDKSRPKIGDVLLTKDGTIGRVAVVDKERLCINQSVALLRPNEEIKSEYLKYLLQSPYYQSVMEGDSDGSTIKHIYITRVDKMQVAVPPIHEQSEILEALNALDDRITLLRETNATLEAIAQALFKSWFVDFDPVRAKMEGLVPEGMDEATAALFPDSFEETELGEVPKGWRISSLSSISNISWGNTKITKSWYRSAGYPAFSAAGQDGFVEFAERTGFGSVISAIGTIGNVYLASGSWTAIKNTLVAQSENDNESLFIHFLLKTVSFPSRGSTQLFISLNDARNIRVLCPPLSIRLCFGQKIKEIIECIINNAEKASLLKEIRDSLLPRLISGKITL